MFFDIDVDKFQIECKHYKNEQYLSNAKYAGLKDGHLIASGLCLVCRQELDVEPDAPCLPSVGGRLQPKFVLVLQRHQLGIRQ